MDSANEVKAEVCKIIHIPDKPPVSPHLQPTVNVHAAVIEPKHANTIVRNLNQIAPMENFRHVKRVRKRSLEGGKWELSVILCLACENGGELGGIPREVIEVIKQYQSANMLHQQKKNGKNSAKFGQRPFIHPHITSLA